MPEVLFYHLSESTLETALPTLLEKALQRGWKAVVQFGSEERRDALNAQLWTWREDSFIGHGTDQENHLPLQPVVLTVSPANPNRAEVRFLVDGAEPDRLDSHQRVVLIFDGHDQAQIEAARQHWKRFRSEGHDVTYWQQSPGGGWRKKD